MVATNASTLWEVISILRKNKHNELVFKQGFAKELAIYYNYYNNLSVCFFCLK
ncbi:MAG: hypothetical protein HW390_1607 [Candidatus Brocadiaceae bacterium]|nr:hypothetical protein [Candidatus Brocadiaceae bacterium]